MRVLKGDLLELAQQGELDVLIHGCNCQCTMGAGIAKQIKNQFPEAFEADRLTGISPDKLGSLSFATIQREMHNFVVVNGYTQIHWRGSGVKVRYEAIRAVMYEVKRRWGGKRIRYPRIGAGLGGGDWSVISALISEELDGEDHALVEYECPR